MTNCHVWTPDSQWVVYDIRPSLQSFLGEKIERINVDTLEQQIVYQSQDGSYVGVVTVAPREPVQYVFIHGPENPDNFWQYAFHHRRGVIVHESGIAQTLDACDITPPYTVGALRGGSHVHVFNNEGSWLSFTYHDHVLYENNPKWDQRNVALAVPLSPVVVSLDHPREYSGSHFCTVISQTVAEPRKDSDQIDKAYEECWIGDSGYLRLNGSRQERAVAFLGNTRSATGKIIPEIFVVDLPSSLQDFAVAGSTPLEGTDTTMPAPPRGVVQRRITRTENHRYPGVATSPRHWLRTSPDGAKIAFLMKDGDGIVQLWWVSPNGGMLHQITRGVQSVQSALSWNPEGDHLAFVMDNRIVTCRVADGKIMPLTERSDEAPLAEAVVYSPDGNKIAYMRYVFNYIQLFCVEIPTK